MIMKNSIFSLALAMMAIFGVEQIAAQSTQQSKPKVESTQSVTLSVSQGLGLHYGYEIALGRLTTITGRIGGNAGARWGTGFFDNYHVWMVAASIDIEPRFYYGLDRRAALGRSTASNQGSFVAVNIKNILPCGYISDRQLDILGGTIITPQWGTRLGGKRWITEFTAGVNLAFPWNGQLHVTPEVTLRLIYSF